MTHMCVTYSTIDVYINLSHCGIDLPKCIYICIYAYILKKP